MIGCPHSFCFIVPLGFFFFFCSIGMLIPFFSVRSFRLSSALDRKPCAPFDPQSRKLDKLTNLTSPAHSHVYILEKSQHKVPEEALKVSNTDSILKIYFILVVLAFHQENHSPRRSPHSHPSTLNRFCSTCINHSPTKC